MQSSNWDCATLDMKKLIISLSAWVMTSAGFAQGLVNVGNNASTDIYTLNGNGIYTATAGSAAASFDYELLTAPSTLPTGPLAGYAVPGGGLQALLSGPWSDTGLTFHNSALAGRVSGPDGLVVSNWPSAAAQDFIVVGWSANLGTWNNVAADLQGATLQQFGNGLTWGGPNIDYGIFGRTNFGVGGYIGATVVGDVLSGEAGTGAGPNIFGTVSTGASPINMTTALYPIILIPEPTTFALLGLGAASMLIFRRRK
jgi:hypothetical protein